MRKFLVGLIVFLSLYQRVMALEVPAVEGQVVDQTGVISDEAGLEEKLAKYNQETGNEIGVLVVKNLDGEVLEDYAVRVFETWGVGKKGKDNGVLLLVSIEDKKIRIEVGYGLEGVINDAKAGRIIRDDMAPKFKEGKYGEGVEAGVDRIIEEIGKSGEIEESGSESGDGISLVFVFGVVILVYLSAFMGRTKEFVMGGVVGFLFGAIFEGVVMGIVLGLIGLGLDFLLSKNYKNLVKLGRNTDFFSSKGGFSGWKGGGGFGGGGGGGFGGGKSGGGGASGGW